MCLSGQGASGPVSEYSGCVADDNAQVPDAAALAAAVDLARSRPSAAQLVVVHGGRVIVDHSQNCNPDDLFWVFSASKPYVVVLIFALAERGLLGLDEPVARYWPEFGSQGKDRITIRHVLQHRTGFSTARGFAGDALAMTNWDRSVRAIASLRPGRPPGSKPAYQVFAFGFILGQIVERVTGRTLRAVLQDEVLTPIGVRHTHLGVDVQDIGLGVPLSGDALSDRVVAAFLNRAAVRAAVIPSAGISTTARDLATLYSMLLAGGAAIDGTRVLSVESIREAVRLSAPTETDLYANAHIAWANGFQLGGLSTNPLPPLGRSSGPRAFGHNGSNICVGWADPDRDLVVAYLTSRLSADAQTHITDVSDALIAAFPMRS